MTATLEHANFTVSDPHATAAWMTKLFDWHIRWEGAAINGGYTIHVGDKDRYLAIYSPNKATTSGASSYDVVGGLNHLAVVVDDLDKTEAAIKAHGFKTSNHGDYEPGRRFYFHDGDGIEYEVVQYD
ncbi:VOC family protein [Sulfitobacter sp. F26204]|uniref:VOC family protein n=1 Tax=Sulfitobacter sp. F26204 TaxID=2996014 RepID=UPI00225DD4A3|nr:VOC family protein [Sulfitobacter sp. F26204]MCX7558806.1 VOC family protein [Sulfitobacter sp. F26204]